MPGTGKTATTLEVVNSMKAQKQTRNFDFVHINAMSLNNPNLVYTIIYESIVGRKVGPTVAALFLDEFFKKKDKTKILMKAQGRSSKKTQKECQKICDRMRVVLIDELDALVT